MSSGGLEANCIAESENVVVGLVLKSVLVYINTAGFVSKTSIYQKLMRLAGWVNARSVEVFLDCGSGVNVLEDSNLSLELVMLDFNHLPAEHYIDTALVALLESDLICVGESVNFFIGSPVLNTSVVSSTAVELILSHKVLVV